MIIITENSPCQNKYLTPNNITGNYIRWNCTFFQCIQRNSQDLYHFLLSLSFKGHTVSQQSKPISQIRVATKINSYVTDCTKRKKDTSRDQAWSKKNPHNTFFLRAFLHFWGLVIPSGLSASLSMCHWLLRVNPIFSLAKVVCTTWNSVACLKTWSQVWLPSVPQASAGLRVDVGVGTYKK